MSNSWTTRRWKSSWRFHSESSCHLGHQKCPLGCYRALITLSTGHLWLLDVFPEVWPPSFLPWSGQTVVLLPWLERHGKSESCSALALTDPLSLPSSLCLGTQETTCHSLFFITKTKLKKKSLGWELPGGPVVRTGHLAAAALHPPTLPPTKKSWHSIGFSS